MRVERTCPVCAAVFSVDASRLAHGRGVHCSKACQYAANRTKLAKPKVTLICVGCGDEFERLPSTLKNKNGAGKFCTRECRDTHWVGDLTPNFQDGSKTHNYGPRWYSSRRAALERDNHTCQHCGATGELHVHHEVPFRMFDGDCDAANDLDNLISLCPPCHRREEARWRWVRIGESIVRMTAASEVWAMHRALVTANDNQPLTLEVQSCA